MSTPRKIRVGIIGLGRIARRAHIPCFRMHRNVEIVGVTDTSESVIKAAKRTMKVDVATTDQRDLLKADLDLVDICTPPATHAAICNQVMEHCRNILVEKPLATTLADAKGIADKAARLKVNVCVVQNYRFKPSALELKRSQEDGTLGKLLTLHVIAHWHSPNLMSDHVDMLFEQIHYLDIITWMCGRPSSVLTKPVRVLESYRDVSDFVAMIDFSGERIAILDWACFSGTDDFIIDAFGTGSWARTDIWRDTFAIVAGRSKYPFETIVPSLKYTTKMIGTVLRGRTWQWLWSGHANLIAEYVKAIESGGPPPVSAESCLNSLELAESIRKSLYLGEEVKVSENTKTGDS